jgi:hypothetical protein
VEYAINEEINYDESVLEKFPVSTPTPIELIMAGMALSEKDRTTQANNKYISNFPSWPLCTPEEIKTAVCSSGLQVSCGVGYYSLTAMKTQTTTFETMEKLIGVNPPSGYGTLSYLSAMTVTTRTERFAQQALFWKASLSIELPLTALDPIHPKVSSRPQPLVNQVIMVR